MFRRSHILIVALLALASSASADFDLGFLRGKWVIVNIEGKGLAQPIQFQDAALGFDAVMPFFQGLSAVTPSDGRKGSHIKIESKDGEKCFYYVVITGNDEMTWALADDTGAKCVRSAVYHREKLLDTDKAEKDKIELLSDIGNNTNLDAFEQIFGLPKKIITHHNVAIDLRMYPGRMYDTYLLVDNYKKIIGVGVVVSSRDQDHKVPVPVLVSGRSNLEMEYLGKVSMKQLMDRNAVLSSGVDAKFQFFMTKTYFGKPGSYYNYYFGFTFGSSECGAKVLKWSVGQNLVDLDCIKMSGLRPLLSFVGFGVLDQEIESAVANDLMYYIYWESF